jgi:hypothetical protein
MQADCGNAEFMANSLASPALLSYSAGTKEDVPRMYSVSRADGLCLVGLLCLDLSLWSWWPRRQHDQDTAPPPPTSIVASADPIALPSAPASTEPEPPANNDPEAGDESEPAYPQLQWAHTYGDYTLTTIRSAPDANDRLVVTYQGRVVFELTNHWIFDPEKREGESGSLPAPLTDLTGEQLPCLVVESFSGGAHCCTRLDVLQLGEEFKHLGTIDAHDGGAEFQDVDGDGIPEVLLGDWGYAYVFTSYASSPVPEKILRYQDGQYVAAPTLLFTEPPTEEEYAAVIQEIADAHTETNAEYAVHSPAEWGGPVQLWDEMLELTYKGHLDLATNLFERCWQPQWTNKVQALEQFWDAVGGNLYGRAVVQAQGYDLPEPEPGKDESPLRMHILDYSDSLASIAKKYTVSVEALMEANNITHPWEMHYGQRLVIPEP